MYSTFRLEMINMFDNQQINNKENLIILLKDREMDVQYYIINNEMLNVLSEIFTRIYHVGEKYNLMNKKSNLNAKLLIFLLFSHQHHDIFSAYITKKRHVV